jgi:hypothetical protein
MTQALYAHMNNKKFLKIDMLRHFAKNLEQWESSNCAHWQVNQYISFRNEFDIAQLS